MIEVYPTEWLYLAALLGSFSILMWFIKTQIDESLRKQRVEFQNDLRALEARLTEKLK